MLLLRATSRFRSSRVLTDARAYAHSTPVPMQYEKFHIPDALRILDGIVETLTY